MYAEVLLNSPRLHTTFYYEIPEELTDRLDIGHLVVVPFGRQRVQGIVVAIEESHPLGDVKMKSIEYMVDHQPVMSRCQIEMLVWLADHYCAPLGACASLMLPAGISQIADSVIDLQEGDFDVTGRNQIRLVGLLRERGALRGRQLDRVRPRLAWRTATKNLVKLGIVSQKYVLTPPTVRPRKAKSVMLAMSPSEACAAMPNLGRDTMNAALMQKVVALWPAEPVIDDLLALGDWQMHNIRALATRGWLKIIPSEVVVIPISSSEVAESWLSSRQAIAPRQAEVVRALIDQQDIIPLSALPGVPMSAIKSLESQEILRQSVNPSRLKLSIPLSTAKRKIPSLRKSERLVRIVEYLLRAGADPVDVKLVCAATASRLADLRRLAEQGLVVLGESEIIRDPVANIEFIRDTPATLVGVQREVWSRINRALAQMASGYTEDDDIGPFLLHGVTGSGKTEIYLKAVTEALRLGKQSVVLIPEIALAPQTVRRFLARFPGRVGLTHSQLSEGERFDTWRRAREGKIDVVIGARSALFAPLADLGLIVVDEEHDEGYRQSPPMPPPYYNARDVAIEYAKRAGAVCILGSATPDIVTYHHAICKRMSLEELPERMMGHSDSPKTERSRHLISSASPPAVSEPRLARSIPLPKVRIVDMRQELRAGHYSMFSRTLIDRMRESLARREQIILFLNRRGHATYVFCRDCGKSTECGSCGIPLTYHSGPQQMICHHCNARRRVPRRCEKCRGSRVRFFGVGTEGVEDEVRRIFPDARTIRWDWDSTRARGSHYRILRKFSTGDADILIGTQMIAKGLDLPLVTLVGIVSADVGLNLPDYRAAERTFQILTQVSGRAGRGMLGGKVVLQTYIPRHHSIEASAAHDYSQFYAQEMALRRELGYPPFGKLARIVGRNSNPTQLEKEARKITVRLKETIRDRRAGSTTIIGPAPCFFGRVAGRHRWQVIVRGPDPATLLDGPIPKGWLIEIEPLNLL